MKNMSTKNKEMLRKPHILVTVQVNSIIRSNASYMNLYRVLLRRIFFINFDLAQKVIVHLYANFHINSYHLFYDATPKPNCLLLYYT